MQEKGECSTPISLLTAVEYQVSFNRIRLDMMACNSFLSLISVADSGKRSAQRTWQTVNGPWQDVKHTKCQLHHHILGRFELDFRNHIPLKNLSDFQITSQYNMGCLGFGNWKKKCQRPHIFDGPHVPCIAPLPGTSPGQSAHRILRVVDQTRISESHLARLQSTKHLGNVNK